MKRAISIAVLVLIIGVALLAYYLQRTPPPVPTASEPAFPAPQVVSEPLVRHPLPEPTPPAPPEVVEEVPAVRLGEKLER